MAIKWHMHIFKWHSAGWLRAPLADCDWSAIGPPTQENFFCHGQKRDYLSRVSQCARGGATKTGAQFSCNTYFASDDHILDA